MVNNNLQSLKFQKEYWFIDNGEPAVIEPFIDVIGDRKRKLRKIVDKMNGVKHKYQPYSNIIKK